MEEHTNLKATKVVMAANALLISSKLSVALLTGSIGVIAVLVDSCFDLVGSLLAYFGVKKASEPADFDHLYGHKKYEPLASLAQLLLIAITAGLIILESVRRLASPRPLEITAIDLAVMLFTVAVDVAIVLYLRKNADHSSTAMQASVGNYTSDILQNSLVFVALAAAGSGFPIADPIAALIVAGLMLRVVYKVGARAFEELTDASPPKGALEGYGKIVLSVKGVKSFHRLRARMVAGSAYVDLHVQLDPKMPLDKAHGICTAVRARLAAEFPEINEVLVHAEPYSKKLETVPKFGS